MAESANNAAVEATGKHGEPLKSFKCPSCDRRFGRSENLRRHVRSHSVVQPHRCPLCEKSFSRSDLRRRHEATHATVLSEAGDVLPRRFRALSNQEDPGRHAVRRKTHHENSHSEAQPERLATVFHSIAPRTNVDNGLIPAQDSSPNILHPEMLSGNISYGPQEVLLNVDDISSTVHGVQSSLNPFLPTVLEPEWVWHNPQNDFLEDWFDMDFFTAIAEMGVDQVMTNLPQSNFFAQLSTPHNSDFENHKVFDTIHAIRAPEIYSTGRFNRVSSPPNEASEEDKWPYTWDPRSRGIHNALPIIVPDNHPLLHQVVPEMCISEKCYQRVRTFLSRADLHGFKMHSFTLPSLAIANAFISCFFKMFDSCMIVIHRASISSMEELPDALISVIIAIGAIYSRHDRTRRFAIVFLDVTRLSLQLSLELDNSLMREPFVIYAAALICQAGLWIGNKRLFELSESLRGAVVTYCRRNHFSRSSPSFNKRKKPHSTQATNLAETWKSWVAEEVKKRVSWVVYNLDCQVASLLYLPPMIWVNELTNAECPCDEEFWQAPTARKWKRLLGPASVPPSKRFASVVAPFLNPINHSASDSGTSNQQSNNPLLHLSRIAIESPMLKINAWTRKLVLLALHAQILEFSQRQILSGAATEEGKTDSEDEEVCFSQNSYYLPSKNSDHENCFGAACAFIRASQGRSMRIEQMQNLLNTEKTGLKASILLYKKVYGKISSVDDSVEDGPSYFNQQATLLLQLADLLLEVSIQDLQNTIGKAGEDGIEEAKPKLQHWASCPSQQGLRAVHKAFDIIRSIDQRRQPPSQVSHNAFPPNFAPLELISFFLANLTVWAFLSNAPAEGRKQLEQYVAENSTHIDPAFRQALQRAALAISNGDDNLNVGTLQLDNTDAGCRRIMFKYTAEVLTHLGPWGASLNLALLLHQRAKM